MEPYETYEQYRNRVLSDEEQLDVADAQKLDEIMRNDPSLDHKPGGVQNRRDGVFVPYPMVQAHMGIAMERAKAQFADFDHEKLVMPEGENIALRFPGVDPVGKYSDIDMKFAQREAAVRSALESRSPAVQEYVKGLLDKCKDSRSPFYNVKETMVFSASHQRIVSRASKLCLDPDGSRLLDRQARVMETELPVVQYDQLMQGLEYAAGVRRGPVPQEITDFYRTRLNTELDMDMVRAARSVDRAPAQLQVEFENLENKLLHSAFAAPENWGKSAQEVKLLAASAKAAEIAQKIPPYAVATADRVISPAFSAGEKVGSAFDRAGLIIIDGKTVKEKMREDYARAQGDPALFNQFYQQNMCRATNEYVASALMAGNRVEAFIPDGKGRIPAEPTPITKTGYEPSPLKPEHFNAWERFFSRHGFYKKKVARQQEYERMMAARERVKANCHQEQVERLEGAVARAEHFTTSIHKDLFFGPILDELGFKSVGDDGQPKYDWGKMNSYVDSKYQATAAFSQFTRSEPMDTCVCYLAAKGHSFRDIMDPNKLQAERLEAARVFMEKMEAKDLEWLGQVYYDGHKVLLEQARALTTGMDLRDNDTLTGILPEAAALLHTAFSVSQVLKNETCTLGYHKAALADAGGDPALASQKANALNDKVNDASLYADELMAGVTALAALANPAKELGGRMLSFDLGTMRLCLDHMKEGPSIVEKACPFSETMMFRSGASTCMPLMEAMSKLTDTPAARAAVAESAASGKLMEDLQVKDFRLVQGLDRNGKPFQGTDYVKSLKVGADGKYTIAVQEVFRDSPDPKAEFELGESFSPELKQKAPQVQAKARQQKGPQRQQSPAKMGGPRL